MRVCSVGFTLYSSDGRVRRACEALARRGASVLAITLEEPGRPDRELVGDVQVERVPVSRLTLAGEQRQGRYVVEYGAFFAEAIRRLVVHHLRQPFDLVHVNNMPDALVFAASPLKMMGVPVLLDVHDLMPDLYRNKFGDRGSGSVLRGLVAQLRASAAFADAILTVHDQAKALLVSYGIPEHRIHVVLNVSDDSVFDWRGFKEPSDEFVIAYHGSISHRHGLDLAVEAFARVRDRLPGRARMKIVGDGDAVGEIARLCERLELRESVELTPHFIPVERLPEFLSDADLAVSPYRRDPATDLMLPSRVFDCGTMGIPCIVSRLACASRYFGEDEVRFVPDRDVDALGEAMVELANDVGARRRLVDALKAKVDVLSWKVQSRIYENLVDDLVAGRIRQPPARAVLQTIKAGLAGLVSPRERPPGEIREASDGTS